MTVNVERAAIIARLAHAGQKYGDKDYFETHVLDVVDRVLGDSRSATIHAIVAYLHDVVEDTDVTLSELKALGFSLRACMSIDAITRKEGENYMEYIERVKLDHIAAFVKYHDLRSNTNTATPVSMARRNLKAMAILKPDVERIYGVYDE